MQFLVACIWVLDCRIISQIWIPKNLILGTAIYNMVRHVYKLYMINFPFTSKGDILEDPANEPKKDMYMMTVDPEEAPNQPE